MKQEENNYTYDFTSPVASFLKESKRQVERYFRGETSDSVESKTDLVLPEKSTNKDGKIFDNYTFKAQWLLISVHH